ncbi:PREDICTED: polyadenylate-binding protein 2-like [Camelina sativa]|uniref:Polyadenylate-binding protein 2-like n=1 Tax=Camelina sativa TaxID=90675 RepID=A0ABM0XFH2_CAMSA|nr:PREDICTED: polyadenylate-binding protein 2-like [Camelina sativa]
MALKEGSASTTDVEAATQTMIVNLTKQRKEIDEITNSLSMADLEDILLKEIDEDVKNAFKKKTKKVEEYVCNYDNHEEAFGNNHDTIFVKGFDCSLSRDDIKSSLEKHFGSCGEISRVFVPFECKTGSPLGYAFIDLRNDAKKALTLDGSYMGSLKLEVVMANSRTESVRYPNFSGCGRCSLNLKKRNYAEFSRTGGGCLTPRTPELDGMFAEDALHFF